MNVGCAARHLTGLAVSVSATGLVTAARGSSTGRAPGGVNVTAGASVGNLRTGARIEGARVATFRAAETAPAPTPVSGPYTV